MNVSVRISLARVRDVQTLDQGLIIDIKSKEVLQVIIGGVRSWKPQSQSLSSGLWIKDGWVVVACRIIVSAQVPVPFL